MVEFLLDPVELLAQFIAIFDDVFEFILVDLEELVGLELDNTLFELTILFLKLPYHLFQLLIAWGVYLPRGLSVVWGLRISEEGLLWA